MKQRKFSAESKMAIVLNGLKGDISITELCKKHQISQSLYYKWRDAFLEAGKNRLEVGKSNVSDTEIYKNKIAALEHIIGKLVIDSDYLKKNEISLC
jgi:transposase-like protein